MNTSLRTILASGTIAGAAVMSLGLAGPALADTGPSPATNTASDSGPPAPSANGEPNTPDNTAPSTSGNGPQTPSSTNGGTKPGSGDTNGGSKPDPGDPGKPTDPTATALIVTVQSGHPGQQVRIRAVVRGSDHIDHATAHSLAFTSDVPMDPGHGPGVVGTATLKDTAEPGTYKVSVTSDKGASGYAHLYVRHGSHGGYDPGTPEGKYSNGSHQNGGYNAPQPPASNDGQGGGSSDQGQTSVAPHGGAQTGGGGAAASPTNLPLVAGGGTIALVGVGAGIVAFRRYRLRGSGDHAA